MVNLIVEKAVEFYKRMDKEYSPLIRAEAYSEGGTKFWVIYLDDNKILSIFPRKDDGIERLNLMFWLGEFLCRQSFYHDNEEVYDKVSFLLACHIYMYKYVLPLLKGFRHIVYSLEFHYLTPITGDFYADATIWDKKDDWLLFFHFDQLGGVHYHFVYHEGSLQGIWTPQARSKVYTYLKSVLFSRI